jgi:hypothetical protein
MRKLLTWVVVTFGVATLLRRLKHRRRRAEPALSTGDPAAELRQKLAETRTEAVPAEPAPESPVAERRATVHDEGRAALEEMQAHDRGE